MCRRLAVSILILPCFIFVASCKKNSEDPTPLPPINPPPPVVMDWSFEATPEWEEDFNVDGPPGVANWFAETGGHGWGNNELQYYTNNANAIVENGMLKITARKENFMTSQYTSAKLITKGKKQWLYGSMEVRAKL
ncbi:MAG: glycoside hydrolase family 16 protein, partial [Flavitalea sp.]